MSGRQVNVVKYDTAQAIPDNLYKVGAFGVAAEELRPDDLLWVDGTVYAPGDAVKPGVVTWGAVVKTVRLDLPSGVRHIALVYVETPVGDPWYYWFDVETYTGLLAILF